MFAGLSPGNSQPARARLSPRMLALEVLLAAAGAVVAAAMRMHTPSTVAHLV